MLKCADCAGALPPKKKPTGRPRRYCDECLRVRKNAYGKRYYERTGQRHGVCENCGGPCQQVARQCRACHQELVLWPAARRPRMSQTRGVVGTAPPNRCVACGIDVGRHAYRCRACAHAELLNLHMLLGIVEHPRAESLRRVAARRKARELAAPGYFNTYRRRKALLDRWVRQGRACFYCDGPAESVDHVVPLTRGGTNHEGNLVPACTSCNAAKWNNLLIAWRSGRTGRPYAGRSAA